MQFIECANICVVKTVSSELEKELGKKAGEGLKREILKSKVILRKE